MKEVQNGFARGTNKWPRHLSHRIITMINRPHAMGRLLSEQDSSPLERSDFTRDEIEAADEAKVPGGGWIEIKDVALTDKGTVISWEEQSDKYPEMTLEQTAYVDDIRDLR